MDDQRALSDQLRTLIHMADKEGLYDASDFVAGKKDDLAALRARCEELTDVRHALTVKCDALKSDLSRMTQWRDEKNAKLARVRECIEAIDACDVETECDKRAKLRDYLHDDIAEILDGEPT